MSTVCIAHDIELYGIKDENNMVVNLIHAGLPNDAKNNLDILWRQREGKQEAQYTSVTLLLEDHKTFNGPSSIYGLAPVSKQPASPTLHSNCRNCTQLYFNSNKSINQIILPATTSMETT